ncbi:hypothetical protein KY284_006623 [Solanum tuberosum]|nr:hypothetical protein KY284_006623 [Solanum tuberosum]
MEAYYDECKKDGLLINGKKVISFFKVMIVETFLQVLFFPPKFARSVPHLTDREIYLEDSRGRRWMATMCNYNGSLAIRQGWDNFSAEHDLKVVTLAKENKMKGLIRKQQPPCWIQKKHFSLGYKVEAILA